MSQVIKQTFQIGKMKFVNNSIEHVDNALMTTVWLRAIAAVIDGADFKVSGGEAGSLLVEVNNDYFYCDSIISAE